MVNDATHHLLGLSDHVVALAASALTYGGGGTALLFWGLQLSELGVIVSMFATLCGLALQIWVTRLRIRILRETQRRDETSD